MTQESSMFLKTRRDFVSRRGSHTARNGSGRRETSRGERRDATNNSGKVVVGRIHGTVPIPARRWEREREREREIRTYVSLYERIVRSQFLSVGFSLITRHCLPTGLASATSYRPWTRHPLPDSRWLLCSTPFFVYASVLMRPRNGGVMFSAATHEAPRRARFLNLSLS